MSDVKHYTLPIRSTMADDNVCAIMTTGDIEESGCVDCSKCTNGCAKENWNFSVDVYKDQEFIMINHKRNLCGMISEDFTERISFDEIRKWIGDR